MTEAEVEAAWTRYMHRSDLSADLPTIWTMAESKISERIMAAAPDPVDVMAAHPRTYLHAGLVYLHELAQDDEGLMRETALFDAAMVDLHFRRSIDAGPAELGVPRGT